MQRLYPDLLLQPENTGYGYDLLYWGKDAGPDSGGALPSVQGSDLGLRLRCMESGQ